MLASRTRSNQLRILTQQPFQCGQTAGDDGLHRGFELCDAEFLRFSASKCFANLAQLSK